MPRFVILFHETPPTYPRPAHYDLMLEQDGALRTWALAHPPAANTAIAAEQLSDHRLDYLDYEGPVSGDRGVVTRWDAGEYVMVEESPQRIIATLCGAKLHGRLELKEVEPGSVNWLVRFLPAADSTGD